MRWNVNGRDVWHPDNKYRIKWDRKAPSKGAQTVKDFLKKHCSAYVWYEEFRLPSCLLRVDFLSPTKKIAIEFQGKQHDNFSKHFHKDRSGYLAHIKRDMKKLDFLSKNGYTVIEITDNDFPLTRQFFIDTYQINL